MMNSYDLGRTIPDTAEALHCLIASLLIVIITPSMFILLFNVFRTTRDKRVCLDVWRLCRANYTATCDLVTELHALHYLSTLTSLPSQEQHLVTLRNTCSSTQCTADILTRTARSAQLNTCNCLPSKNGRVMMCSSRLKTMTMTASYAWR